MPQRYLKSIRLLSECCRAFEQLSGKHIRQSGLTPSQFDIIATLGNTAGLCFRELGAKTLITKGTLTGVVDRLEAKGLVERVALEDDRRRMLVRLTAEGEDEFKRCFLLHVDYCGQAFADYRSQDFDELDSSLKRLKSCLLDTDTSQ